MPASTFTQLMASTFRLTTFNSNEELPPLLHGKTYLNPSQKPSPAPSEPFPIAQLPCELRRLIYTHYFASLPTQNMICSNARLPRRSLTSLALSSPFLAFDPAQNLVYHHATFSFSCPEALKHSPRPLPPHHNRWESSLRKPKWPEPHPKKENHLNS